MLPNRSRVVMLPIHITPTTSSPKPHIRYIVPRLHGSPQVTNNPKEPVRSGPQKLQPLRETYLTYIFPSKSLTPIDKQRQHRRLSLQEVLLRARAQPARHAKLRVLHPRTACIRQRLLRKVPLPQRSQIHINGGPGAEHDHRFPCQRVNTRITPITRSTLPQ